MNFKYIITIVSFLAPYLKELLERIPTRKAKVYEQLIEVSEEAIANLESLAEDIRVKKRPNNLSDDIINYKKGRRLFLILRDKLDERLISADKVLLNGKIVQVDELYEDV